MTAWELLVAVLMRPPFKWALDALAWVMRNVFRRKDWG
jgi:hypothetical protein